MGDDAIRGRTLVGYALASTYQRRVGFSHYGFLSRSVIITRTEAILCTTWPHDANKQAADHV